MNKEKKNKQEKKINGWEVLLPLGFILILIGLAMFIQVVFSISFWSLWPFLLVLAGLAFSYLCFHVNHQSKFLFVGVFLFLSGILMLIISSGFTTWNLKQLWPFFSLFLGVSLLLTGRYKKKRWGTFQFIIPSILLIVLSFFFSLFSFGYIKESLSEIVAVFWPLLFVVGGLSMVVVFYEKRRILAWNNKHTDSEVNNTKGGKPQK